MAKEKANKTQQEQGAPVDVKQFEAALNGREKALDEREQALNERVAALSEKETEFLELKSDFDERKETLAALESTLNKKQDLLKKQEELLNERESALKEEKSPKPPIKKKPIGFEFRGQKYKFSDDAPEKIRILGEVMSQKEIAKDEEVLVHLIGGNSSLIEKVYNNG